LISGATGFGDLPPSYTGKQEWPELVGKNAALVKAQLIAETHLQVGQTATMSDSQYACDIALQSWHCDQPNTFVIRGLLP